MSKFKVKKRELGDLLFPHYKAYADLPDNFILEGTLVEPLAETKGCCEKCLSGDCFGVNCSCHKDKTRMCCENCVYIHGQAGATPNCMNFSCPCHHTKAEEKEERCKTCGHLKHQAALSRCISKWHSPTSEEKCEHGNESWDCTPCIRKALTPKPKVPKFEECPECRIKPGSPRLCHWCLVNRSTLDYLRSLEK